MCDIKRLIPKINSKPITLIGMMAVGKTTIGKSLANMLKMPFYDSDECIENKMGKKISQIFETDGEKKFRQYEKNIIEQLLQIKPAIISLGGGACIEACNRQKLIKNATNIWLDVFDDIIIQRVRKTSHRPLVKQKDIENNIKNISRKRRYLYQQTAQLRIEFEYGMNCTQYTHKVIRKLIEKYAD